LQVAVVVKEVVVVAKAAVVAKTDVTTRPSSSGQDCHGCETVVVAGPLQLKKSLSRRKLLLL
jgi:hypothetical protein